MGIKKEFSKNKTLPLFLFSFSKEPYLEHHWRLPKGFIDKNQKNPFNFTREEWNKSLRTGKHPEKIIIQLQECRFIFDSRKAFEQALDDRGYALVCDDKRGYVAVDSHGGALAYWLKPDLTVTESSKCLSV
jgi:hypothetical protein